jgi:hypothetical protein
MRSRSRSSRFPFALSCGAVLLTALGVLPPAALAQPADEHAKAVTLFAEAEKAMERRAYDEACPTFAQIVELEPAKVGVKLALGECYEAAGKPASAAAAYRAAGTRAAAAGDPRATTANEKAAAIEARAPRLTILVPEALQLVPGLAILRDGQPLDASQWGKAIVADPGDTQISAVAPGKKAWSVKVTVTAGLHTQVVVGALAEEVPAVPPLAPAIATSSPAAATANPGLSVGPRPIEAEAPSSRAVPRWAWVAGGLGVVSGGLAIAFAADQAVAQNEFDAHCRLLPRDEAACGAQSNRLFRDFGLWLGLGAAGVAGLAAATFAIVTAPAGPAPKPERPPVRTSFWLTPEGAGAGLHGQF